MKIFVGKIGQKIIVQNRLKKSLYRKKGEKQMKNHCKIIAKNGKKSYYIKKCETFVGKKVRKSLYKIGQKKIIVQKR